MLMSGVEEASNNTYDSFDYEKLGFGKEDIGAGLDPQEVMKWLGARDELISKFQNDNPMFSEERAASEVSKFLKDTEMVEKYIAFQKRKDSPEYKQELMQQNADNWKDPKILGTYAAWITGGVGFSLFKNKIAEPKFASGEWTPISIKLPFADEINAAVTGSGTADVTSSAAVDVTSSVSNLATTVMDNSPL
eukprot:CAMPEP_0113306960 /NCGR_PEP_ID=MMETSP0010_2-20120614/6006_1 /TAXON_ID=216773 ORGANISM="Corethron hystrix, Strain 308" /NCGR_SAMPLE_ID=MMETSP0010_2 /ASSEMBLY_ACC=CAM_ASM_000155 /LENGTH=191 /DNA_ID=CAMNT_0000161739 /DNA_START=207 /DNA_END=782 /DNA_ORIENTATION=+ /assembly_acc=CAM_ASM_000155